LELNSEAVRAAQRDGLSVTADTVQAFSESHAAAFNAVGCVQVIEHVADVGSFIGACLTCLEENGVFFVAVPNQGSFVGRASNQFLNLPPHHLSRWPREAIEAIARVFSLELAAVVEEPLADYHLAYYVDTCYRCGVRQRRNTRGGCVSSPGGGGLLRKYFERFFLRPILSDVARGMGDFGPRPKGETIIGVYRKRK
jgi:hypothetical protein